MTTRPLSRLEVLPVAFLMLKRPETKATGWLAVADNKFLVGGLEHEFYFSMYLE